MKYQLGFIGAGNMAEAIAAAAVKHGVVAPGRIIAADPTPERRDAFAKLGVTVTDSNREAIAESEQVVIAVKPQMLSAITDDLAAALTDEHVLISIMAGIGSQKLADAIGKPCRIVRVMPNTPMMAGLGMAGVALGVGAKDGDDALALKLFAAGESQAISVPEDDIDGITAVSGSGPAYLFYLAEAMEAAAGELGLSSHARLLASQTLLGAAKLLSESPDTAAELRRKVTSPGGTTEAAIKHMEGNQTREVVVNAIKAAQARARELGA